MQVELEAGRQDLLGDDAAAEPIILFQHEYAQARLGQIGCGRQAVVAGSDYHDVIALRHLMFLAIAAKGQIG
nr:hypothetical protein [Bradyrhizobium sp. SZCCHNR3015]